MDGTQLLVDWLSPLGDTRTSRPTGAPLPMRTVRRIGGADDDITDRGIYSVSTFSSTETDAAAEELNTHRRIMRLSRPGTTFQPDDVERVDGPVTMKWSDAVWKTVSTYRIGIRERS